MKVTLITHTPDPEQLVAMAAKTCYSAAGFEDIIEKLSPDAAAAFIEGLPEAHESPVEHVTFTFGIEGVSRAFLAQLTRHRIASYSVQSQRYVGMEDFDYVIPDSIRGNSDALELYEYLMKFTGGVYATLRSKSIPAEDARYVLPNACATRVMVTMNVRSLYNFFRLRCCKRAQWEIRAVAEEMLRLCRGVAPTLFAKAGAACVHGGCKEGKMGCGKEDAK